MLSIGGYVSRFLKREICRNFRQFEEIVEDFSRIPSLEREGNFAFYFLYWSTFVMLLEFLIPKEDTPPADDPQSLRDSILSQDHSKKKVIIKKLMYNYILLSSQDFIDTLKIKVIITVIKYRMTNMIASLVMFKLIVIEP